MRELIGEPSFTAVTPSFVEIIGWEKDGKRYFAALNQQECAPIAPVHDISITLPGEISSAVIVDSGRGLTVERKSDESTVIIPKVDVFTVIEIS
jgi:hypothetical protein